MLSSEPPAALMPKRERDDEASGGAAADAAGGAARRLADQFPGRAEVLAAVSAVVQAYRREAERDPGGVELEVRFGRVERGAAGTLGACVGQGRKASTGVSAGVVDRAITHVRTGEAVRLSEWRELQDVFFDAAGVEYRSRSTYDTDEMRVRTRVVRKERLAECTLRCADVALRVVASREAACAPPAEVAAPKHVRLQQRRSATFCSAGCGPKPTWTIDFGMAWSGASKDEAEARQAAGETPQYSMELELLDVGYLRGKSDAHVACSLALKAADLLPAGAMLTL